MKMKKQKFIQLIKGFEFGKLFNVMGWSNYTDKLSSIEVKEDKYKFNPIAQMSGFVVVECLPENNQSIPVNSIRKQISNKFSNYHHEHLIIFTDESREKQIWQIRIKEENKPVQTRDVTFYVHQTPEALLDKLNGLIISIDEVDEISLIDIMKRVNDSFDKNAEKVTKNFYKEFQKKHKVFKDFIDGISEAVDLDWYTSIMLNRLMFIYFIQKRRFLDNNPNYLQDKLKETKENRGDNEFYNFYKKFLLVLFQKGLNSRDHSAEIEKEIGKVPYLNGGLFDVHELEAKYDININDDAFEDIFTFFDKYEWHLDSRKTASGKEIDPDVLGYIFEKYINDRAQMGAYYTKEDITEYIAKNTIIPFLFEETKKKHPKAFKKDEEIWQNLQLSDDKYIYDAVKKGIKEASITPYPQSVNELDIPDYIKQGLDTDAPDLLERRKYWNNKTPQEYALPTEIWRETIDRWQRYFDIRKKIYDGEVHSINDFITFNLDIIQFMNDAIDLTDDHKLIEKFYEVILNITILDPACGSGAFLFAALNILEPLYEKCLNKIIDFYYSDNTSNKNFEKIIKDMDSSAHPDFNYFIYKKIIINNLYGVDIMNEAVEIAKLRLFLKLVSTVDVDYQKYNLGIEPLPDIDFNLKMGNSLVGFSSLDAIKDYVEKKNEGSLGFYYKDESDKLVDITDKAEVIDKLIKEFKYHVVANDDHYTKEASTKENIALRRKELNELLNKYMAFLYDIIPEKQIKKYEEWLTKTKPFHWFAEFYSIINDNGGFDVIIGNPPYVVYSSDKVEYSIIDFNTIECNNLYAFMSENAIKLSKSNYIGFIIPSAGFGLPSTKAIRDYFKKHVSCIHVCYFSGDAHPSVLFEGVKLRLSIYISNNITTGNKHKIFTTKYNRWYSEERNTIFKRIHYKNENNLTNITLPKLSSGIDYKIIGKLNEKRFDISNLVSTNKTDYQFYYHNAPVFFIRSIDFLPYYNSEKRNEVKSNHLKKLYCLHEDHVHVLISILNSSIFYFYYTLYSANRDISPFDFYHFPYFNLSKYEKNFALENAVKDLMIDLKAKSVNRIYNYKSGRLEYQEFYMKKSKQIIDRIDFELSKYYGFTEEELDYVINYDIKYRMGDELQDIEYEEK